MKIGNYYSYLSNVNRVERGKVESVLGNKVKFHNANYLVTVERIFRTKRDAESYKIAVQADRRKGWRAYTEE